MDIVEHIKHYLNDSLQVKANSLDNSIIPVANASSLLAQSLLEGHKIMTCGNGPSGSLAQLFVTYLINQFEAERPSLPAIALTADNFALTAIAENHNFNEIYAKQILTLGQTGDILLVICPTGNALNLIQAIEAAHDQQMHVIALTGYEGGDMTSCLYPDDIELRAASNSMARIQEIHLFLLHCLCDLIDCQLFPGHEGD